MYLIAISGFSQELVGYAITKNDVKIDFYKNTKEKTKLAYRHLINNDISITGEFLFYFDKNNRFEKIAQKKLKELNYEPRRYLILPINWYMKRIHEVIAENESFLLTQYYFNGHYYFYVFDKKSMKYTERKILHSYKKEIDSKNFKKYIKPYFKNCPDLLNQIKFNLENIIYRSRAAYQSNTKYAKNYLFRTISNLQCP